MKRVLPVFLLLVSAAQAAQYIKEDTAATVQIGPFLDQADGVTAETGLGGNGGNIETNVVLSKNNGTFAARSDTGDPTHDQDGWYTLPLNSTDTSTPGRLIVQCHDSATYQQVWVEFIVLTANVYDSLVPGSDVLDVNTAQFGGTAGTFASGRPEVNASHIGGSSTAGTQLAEAFDNDGVGGDMDLSSLEVTNGAEINNTNGIALQITSGDDVALSIIASGNENAVNISSTFASAVHLTGAIYGFSSVGVTAGMRLLASAGNGLNATGGGTNGDGAAFTRGGTGGDDLNLTNNDADLGYPANFAALGINASGHISNVTTLTGHTPQTGDSFALVNSGTVGLAVIEAQTDDIGAAGAGLTAVQLSGSVNTFDELISGASNFSAAMDAQGYTSARATKIDTIDTKLPAALVGGRIDASVGAMAANTLTAGAVATDAATEIGSAAGGAPISPFLVDRDHTWRFDSPEQLTAPNRITEVIGFNGIVAMDFSEPMPSDGSISSVSSVTISDLAGEVEPTVVGSLLSANKKKVNVTLNCASATDASYMVTVTILTTDSQTFTRKGRLVLQ